MLEIPAGQSGRLQLAQWIASPANPLTARVFVNRVWAHLMGRGLVPSVDHFGPGGQSSDHQALLDYLAVDFMEHGWSVKHLISRLCRPAHIDNHRHGNQLRSPRTPITGGLDECRRADWRPKRFATLCCSPPAKCSPNARWDHWVATLVGDRPVALIGLDPRIPADLDDHCIDRCTCQS